MNVFSFTGHLGKDCRTNTVSGTGVCNFSVAVRSGYGDKEQTVWVDVSLWGRQAEGKLPDYLTKGQKVAVSGEMGTREHDGKTYVTCRANSVDLIGVKSDEGQSKPASSSGQQKPQQAPDDDFDDDIPF